MPSKSPKQARLMAACSHGAQYDACPPPNVAKEFNKADKGTGILNHHKSRQKAMNKMHGKMK